MSTPIVVVTSWGPAGRQLYGETFVSSFERYADRGLHLVVYHEHDPLPGDWPRFGRAQRDLLDNPHVREFLHATRDDHARGLAPTRDSRTRPWKRKDHERGYNFRFDAHKFGRKIFALADAARCAQRGRLVWIDGDVEFVAPLTRELLTSVHPSGYTMARLRRWQHYHSECGFVSYDLDLHGAEFLGFFELHYLSGGFRKEREWHDSWVFDRLIERYNWPAYDIPIRHFGHAFETSPLGPVMVHRKGDRKHEAGRRVGAA